MSLDRINTDKARSLQKVANGFVFSVISPLVFVLSQIQKMVNLAVAVVPL